MNVQDSIYNAVDSIIQNRLAKINFDTTEEGIVLDDSQRESGIYQVKIDNLICTASSELHNLKKNDYVYILVPKGDTTKTKVITGRKKLLDKDKPVDIKNPLQNYFKMTKNFFIPGPINSIKVTGGPNFSETETQIGFLNLSLLKEAIVNNYKLGISVEFLSNIKISPKGSYGLRFYDRSQNPKTITLLTSEDFIGNPFSTFGYDEQSILLDSTTLLQDANFPEGTSDLIPLYLYQNGQFEVETFIPRTEQGAEVNNVFELWSDVNSNTINANTINTIYIRNIEITGGLLSTDNVKEYCHIQGFLVEEKISTQKDSNSQESKSGYTYIYKPSSSYNRTKEGEIKDSSESKKQIILESDLNRILSTELFFKPTQNRFLRITASSEFQYENDYWINKTQNSFRVKWYHQKFGAAAPDAYMPTGWEILSNDITKKTYFEGEDPFNINVRLSEEEPNEVFKCLVFFEGKTIESNQFIFVNEAFPNNQSEKDDLEYSLTLEAEDGSDFNYYSYQINSKLSGQFGSDYENRGIFRKGYLQYKKEYLSKQTNINYDTTVEWIIPMYKTMINFDLNAFKMIVEESEQFYTSEVDLDQNYKQTKEKQSIRYKKITLKRIRKKIPAEETQDQSLFVWFDYIPYSIKRILKDDSTNNAVLCNVLYGNKTYHLRQDFDFGRGENGDSFIVQAFEDTEAKTPSKVIFRGNFSAAGGYFADPNLGNSYEIKPNIYDAMEGKRSVNWDESFDPTFKWVGGDEEKSLLTTRMEAKEFFNDIPEAEEANIKLTSKFAVVNFRYLKELPDANGNFDIKLDKITLCSRTAAEVNESVEEDEYPYSVLQTTIAFKGISLKALTPIVYSEVTALDEPKVIGADGLFSVLYDTNAQLYSEYKYYEYYKLHYNPEINNVNRTLEWECCSLEKKNHAISGNAQDTNNASNQFSTITFTKSLVTQFFSPQIKIDNQGQAYLVPDNYYDDSYPYFSIMSYFIDPTQTEKKIFKWIEPLLLLKNKTPSQLISDWQGDLTVDKDKNIILSSTMVAGQKELDEEGDKVFTGVIMGSITDQMGAEDNLSSVKSGIFGYNKGESTYALNKDGSMILGNPSNGAITFNGQESTITSPSYNKGVSGQGLCLDLRKGDMKLKQSIVLENIELLDYCLPDDPNTTYKTIRDALYKRVPSINNEESFELENIIQTSTVKYFYTPFHTEEKSNDIPFDYYYNAGMIYREDENGEKTIDQIEANDFAAKEEVLDSCIQLEGKKALFAGTTIGKDWWLATFPYSSCWYDIFNNNAVTVEERKKQKENQKIVKNRLLRWTQLLENSLPASVRSWLKLSRNIDLKYDSYKYLFDLSPDVMPPIYLPYFPDTLTIPGQKVILPYNGGFQSSKIFQNGLQSASKALYLGKGSEGNKSSFYVDWDGNVSIDGRLDVSYKNNKVLTVDETGLNLFINNQSIEQWLKAVPSQVSAEKDNFKFSKEGILLKESPYTTIVKPHFFQQLKNDKMFFSADASQEQYIFSNNTFAYFDKKDSVGKSEKRFGCFVSSEFQ